MLEQLSEWLPQEKLYAMPRSLQTQGIRALGRLAYADHQQRLLGKLKREIQKISHPTRFTSQSARQAWRCVTIVREFTSCLGQRRQQRVLADLGFGLRRLLQQLRHTDAEVTALLFCGAPDDPATPKNEQANIYATLTELNHFADPTSRSPLSTARTGRGCRPTDRPLTRLYLLRLTHRSPTRCATPWRTWAAICSTKSPRLWGFASKPAGISAARRIRPDSAASALTPSGSRAGCCCGCGPASRACGCFITGNCPNLPTTRADRPGLQQGRQCA